VINEYWVTDSTVLFGSTSSATMLLFMQGHRAAAATKRLSPPPFGSRS